MKLRSVSLNFRCEVSSVRKALQILCSFTVQQPRWALAELSRTLGMPKSTTYNLLRTLEGFDFVKQDAADKHYCIGSRVRDLGLMFCQSNDLIGKALPYLRRLAEETGETVKLGLLSSGRVLIGAAVESLHLLHTRGDVGSSWPLNSTGLGKAILARLSPGEVIALVERYGLPRATDHTITSLKELQDALAKARVQGYVLDCEESEKGVLCVAVSLPAIVGIEPASLSISGPSVRLSPQTLRQWAPLLVESAHLIVASLGRPLTVNREAAGAGRISSISAK